MKVAVIGASANPERYSYKALKLLSQKGHEVYPVHPKLETIEGVRVYASVRDLPGKMDTFTMYVGGETSSRLAADILAAKPKRIIFNPGAENPELAEAAGKQGIEPVDACTLVMLSTGQF